MMMMMMMMMTYLTSLYEALVIQDDSGGKVNILRDDIIGHCEKKVRTNMYLIPNCYQLSVIKTVLKMCKIFRVDDRCLSARNALRSREQVKRNTLTKQNQLTDECIITR